MGRGACYQWRSSGRSLFEPLREQSWSITQWRSSKQTRDRIQYLWCFVWILWLLLIYLTTSPLLHQLNNCFKMLHLPCIYLIRIIQITNKSISILGKWPTWRTILYHVFILIFNSLHVSSTSCSSSGKKNCVNTTSGNCHSVSVVVSCASRKFTSDMHNTHDKESRVTLVIYQES